MQWPILSGIYTDEAPDLRTSYPRNMVPVPKSNGISEGYLRPAEGIELLGEGPGPDRGGINWRGACIRVMGTHLVRVEPTGAVSVLGDIPGSAPVTFDYSFDRLAIAGGGGLHYFDGSSLVQVPDTDLGLVADVVWVDGYFMTTDGASLVVTDLNDPMAVNPLKYGSSEVDPDPVVALLKLKNEVYAINRHTIEQFNNVGGNLFPFQRNEGAQMQRGALGTHCAVVFSDTIAFLGGARNEPPAVWEGANSETTKISTREIDTLLSGYPEAELASAVMEVRTFKSHELLYLHLPDRTLVYDANASAAVRELVWYTVDSGLTEPAQYRARGFVWCYDKWIAGDPTSAKVGAMVGTVSTHYGEQVGWEFGTTIVYNESRGAIFHMLELVALPGRVALGAEPVIWTSYSEDGVTWSQERSCPAGKQGERARRITWSRQGAMRNWRIQRFRGNSDAHLAVARLEVAVEPLYA